MEIDYSQEKNHKCPYCPLSCSELDRFKQHLINCRKCNDMDAYVCMYYFGHVFTTVIDLENHHKQCIFNKGPALYMDKKRIKLGKASKEQIINEYYPNNVIQSSNQQTTNNVPPTTNNSFVEIGAPVSTISNPINNISNGHKIHIEPEIIQTNTDNTNVFSYYIFEDIQTLRTFNLTYCFGVEFSVNTFVIKAHKDINEFQDFFTEENFDKKKFELYAALFTLFIPEQEAQSFSYFQKTLGKKIGFDDSKANSHNEVLIAATPDSEVIGKFVKTEIAFLVIPASILFGRSVPTNNNGYYKKIDTKKDKDLNFDPNKIGIEKKKSYKTRLMEDVKESSTTNLIAWMAELQNAQISIPELQDLSRTLDFICEEFENKKKEDRFERNKEMEMLKKEIQENRKFNNELRQILNQKEKKIQQLEENLERDKKNAKSKFDKALKNKLDECEKVFVIKKEELEQEVTISNYNRDTLQLQVRDIKIEVSGLKKKITENNQELEELIKKNKKLEDELKEIIDKAENALKDTGLGIGAPKLSDFTCNCCKVRNKQVVFLPCRHMLRCANCSVNLLEGSSKCEECSCIIENKMEVKKIEYKIPFDEILIRK